MHQFCVAPMLDWTDRHDRYFLRLISQHALLYTEMVTSAALIHGDRDYLLGYHPAEHPIALQLGGSDPEQLAIASGIGEDYGYDEINLNVGCPSDRVQSGRFGACLMAEPNLVADCIMAMRDAVQIPVTIKSRIGIDDQDDYEGLYRFVNINQQAGCQTFIIHARKAWLKGLSPKENREIPPLRYELVGQIKQDFPHLNIIINGGIHTLEQGLELLNQEHRPPLDGIMLGREAYKNPYILSRVDQLFYSDKHPIPQRHEIVEQLIPYIERELSKGTRLHAITRHILGLFQGQPGARQWRRILSEQAPRPDADINVIKLALNSVS